MNSLSWIIFVITYAGVAVGGVPRLAIDRTGIALLGAIAMVVAGVLSPEAALDSISLSTLALLYGLMIVSAQLRLGGFYTHLAVRISSLAGNHARFLFVLMVVAGLLSSVLANDIICLAFTPVLTVALLKRGTNPIPFLLGLAAAANIGSAATIIGNPQNMLIGQAGGLSFAHFILWCGPPSLACLFAAYGLIHLLYRNRYSLKFDPPADLAADWPSFNTWQSVKGLLAAGAVVTLLFMPLRRDWSVITVAGVLLLSRKMHTRSILGLIDWHLITLFGALFLAAQVPNLMRDQASSALQRWVLQLQPLFAEGGALGPGSVVWLPARALFLDPLALAVTLCGAAALAWLTAATLHGTFMSGGRQAVTAPTRRRADAGGVRFRPRSVTRLVLLKEWRLILRDPYLLSQVLLQLVYMVPLLVVLPRGPGSVGSLDLTAGLAGMLVMLAGTLVMGLTLIVVGGEEAHDLLAAAPVPRARLERLKLAAALAPVWALALVPLALLAWQRPALGMLTAVALGLATLSSALLRLWNPAPAKRADLFKRRGRRGDPVMNFVEGLLPLLWGGWVAFVGSGAAWAWWLPPVALALTGAGYLYGPRRAAAARLLTRGERATT